MRLGCGSQAKMRRLLDARTKQDPYALDDHTVERLLGASLPADDAPPEYRPVATVLQSLARRSVDSDVVGESRAVEAVTAAVASAPKPLPTSRRSNVITRYRSAKVAVAALVGGLTLTTGVAMAGALPGAAQDVASSVLSSVGVTTPGPDSHAGDHPNTRGRSGSTPPESSQAPDTTKGSEISGLATTTDATGVDKGAEISGAASGGASQAGQHGPPSSTPPVSTPNAGGAGSAGTGIADNASGGQSSAGSDNSAGHTP